MTDTSGNGTVFVPDFRSEIASEVRLGMYSAMTRARVSGDTLGRPRSARLTVASDTPASRATSSIVARPTSRP